MGSPRVGHDLLTEQQQKSWAIMIAIMRATEDEMVAWHHWFNGHEHGQTPGDDDGQGSLAFDSPQGRKESDTTWPNNNNKSIAIRLKQIYRNPICPFIDPKVESLEAIWGLEGGTVVEGLRTPLDLISVENEDVMNGRGIQLPCRSCSLNYKYSGGSSFLSA